MYQSLFLAIGEQTVTGHLLFINNHTASNTTQKLRRAPINKEKIKCSNHGDYN